MSAPNPTELPDVPETPKLPSGAVWIDAADDPRVRDYFSLTDVALRRVMEPQEGLYIAESSKVIDRALSAGHHMRSLLMAQRWLEDMGELVAQCHASGIPVFVAPADVIESMTGYHLHRGALAAMHRPPVHEPATLVADAKRVVVLEDLVDHTNVGAVFRSAAALGVDAVLVTQRCADPLYRRSIRVSMGAVFQVPWTRIDNTPSAARLLSEAGFVVAAGALAEDAVSLDDLASNPPARLALMLGTEGDGLTQRAINAADLSVRIPMAPGVDSLNVAAASAVMFWALRVSA